jgi:hypothetical protein
MDIPTLLAAFANQGSTMILAVIALVMLNQSWKDRAAIESKHSDQIKEMHAELIAVIKANTQAITTLTERVNHKD